LVSHVLFESLLGYAAVCAYIVWTVAAAAIELGGNGRAMLAETAAGRVRRACESIADCFGAVKVDNRRMDYRADSSSVHFHTLFLADIGVLQIECVAVYRRKMLVGLQGGLVS
jgi:hypothetical protein